MLKFATYTLVFCAVFLIASSESRAGLILIDLNTTNDGVATKTPDGAGNYWNTITGTSQTITSTNPLSLIDITNTPSGITLQLAFGGSVGVAGFTGNAAGPGNPGPGSGPLNQAFAYTDGLFTTTTAGTFTFTFNGLLANTQYDFSVYAGRDASSSTGLVTLITGTGLTGDTSAENRTLANFSATSNASGVIAIRYADDDGVTGDSSVLTSMSITQAVPEPSLALCVLAAFPVYLLRKKLLAR